MLGELVQTPDGKWMTRPPTRCPNGHLLGPNQVLVGHVACLGHGGGGHVDGDGRRADYQVRQVRVGGAVTMPIGGMQNR